MEEWLPEGVACERARERAFWAEVLDCLPVLCRRAECLTQETDAAEDLVQETVLKAWRFRDRYRLGTHCAAWLGTIMQRLFYNDVHSGRRRYEWSDDRERVDKTTDPEDVEGSVLDDVFSRRVWARIGEVPEPYRTAVVMRFANGLSYEQMASRLGVPEGTVKSRLYRGCRFLRKRWRACT